MSTEQHGEEEEVEALRQDNAGRMEFKTTDMSCQFLNCSLHYAASLSPRSPLLLGPDRVLLCFQSGHERDQIYLLFMECFVCFFFALRFHYRRIPSDTLRLIILTLAGFFCVSFCVFLSFSESSPQRDAEFIRDAALIYGIRFQFTRKKN